MEVVLAIGAVQAIFFAILLYNKRHRTLPDKILAVWLLIMSGHLTINYLQAQGYYAQFPHLAGSTSSLVFLYGPILFIYIAVSIDNHGNFKKKYWYHFIPFVLYNLLLIPFYLKSGQEKLIYAENLWKDGMEGLSSILLVIKALFGPVYIGLALWLLKRHKANINQFFSNHESIDLIWLRYIIWSVGAVLALFFFITIAKVNFPGFGEVNSELIIFFAMALWILALGYYGMIQSPIFVKVLADGTAVTKAKKVKPGKRHPVEDNNLEEMKVKLTQMLKEDRPYLQSKLTLPELASKLKIPGHQLSQLINREFNQNFFEFINHYRVEEVKRKIADPAFSHLTLLGIALESGFNSKASFNRIFKRSTGLTPNEYQKELKS